MLRLPYIYYCFFLSSHEHLTRRKVFLCLIFGVLSISSLLGSNPDSLEATFHFKEGLCLQTLARSVPENQESSILRESIKNFDAAAALFFKQKELYHWLGASLKVSSTLQTLEDYSRRKKYLSQVLTSSWLNQTPDDSLAKNEKMRLMNLNIHLGYSCYKLNEYTQSIRAYEQALSWLEKSNPDKDAYHTLASATTFTKFILQPLCLAYKQVEDYQAIAYALPDAFLDELKSVTNNTRTANVLAKLYFLKAEAMVRFGATAQDTIQAVAYYQQAYDLPIKNKKLKAETLINYGHSKDLEGNRSEALKILKEALAESKALESQSELRLNYLYLAYTLRDMGNFSEALRYADSALQEGIKIYPSTFSTELSSIYRLKGKIHRLQGNFSESLHALRKSLKCVLRDYNTSLPFPNQQLLHSQFDLPHIFRMMGDCYLSAYHQHNAFSMLDSSLHAYKLMIQAEDLIKNHQRFSNSRKTVGKWREFNLKGAMNALYAKWKSREQKDRSMLFDQILFFMEKNRAQEMQMAIQQNELSEDNAKVKELKEKTQDAWNYYNEQKLKLDSLQAVGKETDHLRKSLGQLENQFSLAKRNLEDALRKNHPQREIWFSGLDPLSSSEVQSLFPAQATLVSFLESDQHLYGLYMSKDSMSFQRIVNKKVINQQVDFLDTLLQSPRPDSLMYQTYKQIGYELHQKLLGPIEKWETKHLIFIPSTQLSKVPMEILLTQAPDTAKNISFKPLSYLWKNYDIRYLHSASQLQPIRSKQNKAKWDYLGFAPDFADKHSDSTKIIRSGFDSLHYNKEEIIHTANSFPQGKAKHFLGPDAKAPVFVTHAPKAKILHLSTHALSDSVDSELSYLLFHPTGLDIGAKKDKIYMYEIQTLDLSNDLILLSACKTGSGEQVIGEGIISLGRSFHFAGSKSVLMSVKNVNDYAASKLMPLFIQGIREELSKSKALQQARNRLFENPGTRAIETVPYYWAPFVLYGDNSPVELSASASIFNWKLLVGLIVLIIALGLGYSLFFTRNL